MMKKLLMLLVMLSASMISSAFGQERSAKIIKFKDAEVNNNSRVERVVKTFSNSGTENVSVLTGLSGFQDYQSNGGNVQYIAINPIDSNKIHAIYTISTDSADISPTRRVAYAYSSNGGTTWTTVNTLTGATERFPSLTLLPQAGTRVATIGFHSGAPLARLAFQDFEGAPSFNETVPVGLGSDEPIWPAVQVNRDSSRVIMMASRSTASTTHLNPFNIGTFTFGGFGQPLATQQNIQLDGGGRYGVTVAPNGRVAAYHLGGPAENLISYSESTDGGQTFPPFTRLTTLLGSGRISPVRDSLAPWIGVDAVYNELNELNFVFSTGRFSPDGQGYFFDGQGIWFWSQRTGFRNVVDTNKVKAIFGANWEGDSRPGGARTQTNHFPIDYPTISVAPNGELFCVFVVARRDTSSGAPAAAGFNYYTTAITRSADRGRTWDPITILETSNNIDYRYPSLAERSPRNGTMYMVYQQDSQPGSGAFTDLAPVTRASLRFRKFWYTTRTVSTRIDNKVTTDFKLQQNYPNPFNPSTTISYSIPTTGEVSLKVYDMLGREVSTLFNGRQSAGSYNVNFNAASLASGVYFYKLQSGAFTETRKMMLVK
jgi:hypothetical protein